MPATKRQSADKTRRGGEPPLLAVLIAGQRRAVERVEAQGPALEGAARLVAAALAAGGRLVYLGAGSSGLLAIQDGLELPGTFGLEATRIRFVTPEGERFAIDSSGEDDAHAAVQAIDALSLGPDDVVIAVSASGATPFTLAGARRAQEKRARQMDPRQNVIYQTERCRMVLIRRSINQLLRHFGYSPRQSCG